MYKYIYLLLCFLPLLALGQKKVTISGYVKDASSGERIIGASVWDGRTQEGTMTNDYGFFSLTLPADSVDFAVVYSSYQPYARTILLQKDSLLTILLEPYTTDEVVISDEKENRIEKKVEMSTIEIPVEQIKKLPMIFGEVDVIRAVQLQPGVQSGQEGTTGFYVRGGGADQNLILLDGVPLYYVGHLGGIFSVFNADAISDVKLIKGGFPARYGGRLSSVLDIKMKEGNMQKYVVNGTVGYISSKIMVEGPIVKDKASFMISARRNFLDLLMRPLTALAFSQQGGNGNFGYYFYDLNGKVNYIINDKNRIYLSGYLGDDRMSVNISATDGASNFSNKSKIKNFWGNQLSALRWNHIYNPKLFSNLTLTYTNYRLILGIENETQERQNNGSTVKSNFNIDYTSGIKDYGVKYDFDYFPNSRHAIKFGLNAIYHTFRPGVTGIKVSIGDSTLTDTAVGSFVTHAYENYVYAEDKWEITDKISVNGGVHAAHYHQGGKNYFSVQPRFSSRILLPYDVAFKASYSTMTQFLHLLTNSDMSLPIDLWVPATAKVAPQRSWQAAAGFARSILDGKLELSIEGYYKRMFNLIDYKEGISFFGNATSWEDLVETNGKGWAYGCEFLVQKKKGKTTGWIGYTLAWNKRQFDNINNGKVFPFKYDRRHDFSFVVTHELTKKISLSGTWVFGTGNAVTLPTGEYPSLPSNYVNMYPIQSIYLPGIGYYPNSNMLPIYEKGRNGFRMRPYHRLDLAANFLFPRKKVDHTLSVSIYNVYARQNPFFYFFSTKYGMTGQAQETVIKQFSLLPIPIPAVSYSFAF